MTEQLTPCVLPAQPDLPAARIVLLGQNAMQIGATAYSFEALQLIFRRLMGHPEAVQRYGLTSGTVQSRLDCVRPLAQQARIPERLCKMDAERIAVIGIAEIAAKVLKPGIIFSLLAYEESAEGNGPLSLFLDGGSANVVYLMRLDDELKKATRIFSKKMLRFVLSMSVTHPGLKHYKVQQFDLRHAQATLQALDTVPRFALPNTHPAEDAALLARMSNECGEDLLPQYSAYKPPIG